MTTQMPLTQGRATLEPMTTARNSAFSDRHAPSDRDAALAPVEDEPDDTTGSYELEERGALRRVAGLSTELDDVTEVEYRQLRLERVVLVGVWTEGTVGRRRELAGRARRARRDRRLAGARGGSSSAATSPTRPPTSARARPTSCATSCGDRRRHRDLRR